MKTRVSTLLILALTLGVATSIAAQEASTLPTSEEQQKKEKSEKRAFALLEQVADEVHMLKLPENRIRVQIGVADLLWQRDEGRARSLFALAAEGVADILRSTNADTAVKEPRNLNQTRTAAHLRQELILTVARHDAPLAYQFLGATHQSEPAPNLRAAGRPDQEEDLEQRLLAQVAALDPMLALQNAEQMLDKGQYPRSLADVLSQLQSKDKKAAAKLEEKMLKRLQSANMLSTVDAGTLALGLLQRRPRPAGSTDTELLASNGQGSLLRPSAYADLLGILIDAALKAMPQTGTNQRGPNNFRIRNNNPGGGGGAGRGQGSAPTTVAALTGAQMEQNNARRLLGGLQTLLPQIDQHLPARAQAVRQKMIELGMGHNPRVASGPFSAMQQGTSDSLMSSAANAPQAVQSRIYRQAALKALAEGDADRARQIANDHLEAGTRESVLRSVEFSQLADNAEASKIDDVRQKLSRLISDDERIELLLRLSTTARADNQELALQLLDEARQYTNRRASNYQQFEQQLRVAAAFKDLDPERSFEVLEPGIIQLNELLAAAATLSGFDVDVFREGELPLQGTSGLGNMVLRYGLGLGVLARSDFDRAQTLANRFQFTEPRILARLSIVRAMLGMESGIAPGDSGSSPFGQNTFIRPVP